MVAGNHQNPPYIVQRKLRRLIGRMIIYPKVIWAINTFQPFFSLRVLMALYLQCGNTYLNCCWGRSCGEFKGCALYSACGKKVTRNFFHKTWKPSFTLPKAILLVCSFSFEWTCKIDWNVDTDINSASQLTNVKGWSLWIDLHEVVG